MKKEGVVECLCVATSAFRDAKNAKELVKLIQDKYKIRINIISGIVESNLILDAVKESIDLSSHYTLLIDIGGGSTEIKLLRNGNTLKTLSLDIGTVRFIGKSISESESLNLFEFLQSNFRYEIIPYLSSVDSNKLQIIGTGGNLKRLGKLKKKILGKNENDYVKKKHFKPIWDELKNSTYDERVNNYGLRADRAEVIIPAMKILKTCLDDLNWDKVQLPNVGLANGALKKLSEKNHQLIVSYL